VRTMRFSSIIVATIIVAIIVLTVFLIALSQAPCWPKSWC
jgi:hypothetical protein